MGSHLIEPGVRYFYQKTLQGCHHVKETYYNGLYNLGLFAFFCGGNPKPEDHKKYAFMVFAFYVEFRDKGNRKPKNHKKYAFMLLCFSLFRDGLGLYGKNYKKGAN